MTARVYDSFGRTNPPAQGGVAIADLVNSKLGGLSGRRGILAYGNGRSYGDSCQPASGKAVDMTGMANIRSFDATSGVIEAEGGAMLADVIDHIRPHRWFPAVVPGTRFVTIGGAIANDIHGKNHHRRGTFGAHVEALRLLTSDGTIRDCSPTRNPALFAATVGGMGLTGIILSARLRLMKVASADIDERVARFPSLDSYFDLAGDADRDNEYAVAWVDQLATGRNEGRGLLITGNHAEADAASSGLAKMRPTVPFQPPVTLLNRPFLKVFNSLYFNRKGAVAARRSSYESFFFPLDGVLHWNRLYGPKGLFQHQSVIPADAARQVVPAMLAATREASHGSFLTVLKRFGDMQSPGLMSFPRPGYTLTLDFPNRGASTLSLLARLDAMTIEAGGAINPYKDARMGADVFAASFPAWPDLEAMRDPAFLSKFWERTALRLKSRSGRHPIAAE